MYKIDGDFVTSSLNPSGFFNKLDSELVYYLRKRWGKAYHSNVPWKCECQWLDYECREFRLPGYTKDFEVDNRKSYGRVHKGFYDYLFGNTQVGDNGSNKSKAEEIMGIFCERNRPLVG